MPKILHGSLVLVALFLASTLLFTPALQAQATAQISGTVSDATGAVVPNAAITLHNTETNTTRNISADGAGIYTLTNLQPGHYEVSAVAAGFTTSKASLQVEVGGRYEIDPKLQISGSSTTVEVTADQSVAVNTDTPEVSQVITSEEVSQLPSLTRNPYDFVALSGNVGAGDNSSATNYQNGPTTIRGVGFNVNGGRASGTEILLDGVENISVFSDIVAVRVPLDAVQEFRIVTNNFLPEYGRASGGIVSVATKSGTNNFHGSLWEFNRVSATTANTVTNAQTGAPKGKYTRNQFGAEVAGPIKKDKLFFEGTIEYLRVRSAAVSIAAIPTSQLLAAASPNLANFINTYGGPTNAKVVSTTTNLQAGGGTSPLYTSLPNSLPIFNDVSFTAPGDAGGGAPENRYNIVGRVDYTLSQKAQVFFRYSDDHEIDQNGYEFASPYSQFNVGQSDIGQTYLLGIAYEPTAALSTDTKVSFSRANLVNDTFNTALQNVPTLFVASGATDPYTSKPIQLPGFFDTQTGTGGLPAGGPQNTVQVNQDVNYLKGKHSMQAGAQIIYIQMNYTYGAYAQANEIIGATPAKGLQALISPTGSLYKYQVAVNPQGAVPCAENYYTGTLNLTAACTITYPLGAPNFARSDRYHDWAAYAQDQWKATSKFTFDYGVRYEYFGVQHNNKANLDANFYYGPGSGLPAEIRSGSVLTVPNSPIKKLWNPEYGTVSPRIGFAYDVFGNGKTSFRAGYGISYERNFGNVTFNLIQNPPNYAVVVNTTSGVITNSNTIPAPASGNTSGLPPSSLRHVDQNIRTAQTQFHSFSIDQQLAHNVVVEVTYNGSRGTHLYDIKNYNIPGSGNLYLGDPVTVGSNSALTPLNPQFANDNNRGSSGDSYYNGVNFQLNARDVHHSGLSLVANYTFGHSLDDLSTAFSEDSVSNFALGYTNAFNPGLDHGSSDFDLRQRFVVAPIYKLPTTLFRGKSGLLNELLGGYEVTGIFTSRTGTPFSYYDSTNNNSGYQVVRYNPVSPVTKTLFKSIPAGASNAGNAYTLTGKTTLPADNPFGNPALMGISDLGGPGGQYPATMTARNLFRGPGAYNLDASISKQFPIRESVNIELRAEGFDVTNHHNLYIQESETDAGAKPNLPNPQIIGSKGGIGNNGGTNDERRFLQFAAKINF